MAILRMDGYTQYLEHKQARQTVSNLGTITDIVASGGPYGEPYSVGFSGSNQLRNFWGDSPTAGPRTGKLFFQFHGRNFANSGTGAQDLMKIFNFGDSETLHLTLKWTGGSTAANVSVNRGNATLVVQSTTNEVLQNKWQYYQLMLKIHDTEGDVKLIVDGSTIIDSTGLDTKNGGAENGMDTMSCPIGTGSNARHFDIANLLIMSTEGSRLNDFIGERRIVAMLPTANATASQWTRSSTTSTNWQLVDEIPVAASDYVFADSTGVTDSYELSNLTVLPNTMDAINVKPAFHMGDWGPSYTPTCYVQVSTDVDESTIFYPGGDITIEDHIVENDPSGGTGWSLAGVQNMKVGVKT